MKAINLVTIAIGILLLVGVVWATTSTPDKSPEKTHELIQENAECGPDTCDGLCGGSCGIPSCGCGG